MVVASESQRLLTIIAKPFLVTCVGSYSCGSLAEPRVTSPKAARSDSEYRSVLLRSWMRKVLAASSPR
ncbi:hypothetical protein SFUMM280S_01836 [Streptomyces fumanus]